MASREPGRGALRIAFVTPRYITEPYFASGLANYLQRVALALRAFGHQPIVIVSSDRNEALVEQGIEIQRVNVTAPRLARLRQSRLRRPVSTAELFAQSWTLNRRLAQVHARRPVALVQYTHLEAVGLFRPRGLPAVARLSSYTPLVKRANGLPPGLLGGVQHRLEMAALQRMQGVFSPSRLIAELAQQATGQNIRVIESPFLMDAPALDASLFRQHLVGKPYLLFFGQISALKGVAAIADTLADLLGRHPDLYFVLVGAEVPAQPGEAVMPQVWAKAGPYRDRVLYLGPLRHAQLYPILANAAAVVLPSRIDNLPNSAIEAMAFGRIVIGTREASFEQLLTDGRSGFLCASDDPGSLLRTMERVLRLAPDERTAIERAARERVAALRPEIVVRQLLDFYDEVLAKGRPD